MRVAGDVDEQVAEQPVEQPRPSFLAGFRHLRERDLELVERLVARLVDARRLAGRANEQAGEQIRERGVALPIKHRALEQIGAAQERALRGTGSAYDNVAAPAGAAFAAIAHEFLSSKAHRTRIGI